MSRCSRMTPAILLTLGSLMVLGPSASAQTAPPPGDSAPQAGAPEEASPESGDRFPV